VEALPAAKALTHEVGPASPLSPVVAAFLGSEFEAARALFEADRARASDASPIIHDARSRVARLKVEAERVHARAVIDETRDDTGRTVRRFYGTDLYGVRLILESRGAGVGGPRPPRNAEYGLGREPLFRRTPYACRGLLAGSVRR